MFSSAALHLIILKKSLFLIYLYTYVSVGMHVLWFVLRLSSGWQVPLTTKLPHKPLPSYFSGGFLTEIETHPCVVQLATISQISSSLCFSARRLQIFVAPSRCSYECCVLELKFLRLKSSITLVASSPKSLYYYILEFLLFVLGYSTLYI